MMVRILTLLLICLFQLSAYAQKIPKKVRTILFLGNSITYSGGYIIDVEAYLLTHYPGRQFEIINLGLPSETVSGLSEAGHADGKFPRPDLHERLDRVLQHTKPDLVFACYGMNDGIYQQFDESRFNKFKEGINWLHSKVEKTGARLIHITPPVFDGLRAANTAYEPVLKRYSDWLMGLVSTSKWEVIDIHTPMLNYLYAHRKIDSTFRLDGCALARDGVHPEETGHWIIAREILFYLGFKEVVNAPGIAQDLGKIPNGIKILELVKKKQILLRDAWLSHTKHLRPGLSTGLPLEQAKDSAQQITNSLKDLIQLIK